MRIVYVTGSLDAIGGAERVLISKANYFAAHYHYNVHIIVERQSKPIKTLDSSIQIHNLDVVNKLPKNQIPYFGFFSNVKKLKPFYESVLKAIDPDIITVLERTYADFIIPNILPNVPKIRESHASAEAVKYMNKAVKFGLQKLKTKIITWHYNLQLAKYTCLVLLTEQDRIFRSRYKNTIVIPNVIPKFDADFEVVSKTKRVISVGRLDRFKNHSAQIIIWKNVVTKHPDWSLHIYGEGQEKRNLEQLIKTLNLQNNVFLEGVSDTIETAYKQASIFIFTSLAEGFGMVLVEAMQFGLPVVSYDIPCGPREIITAGKDGFLIPINDLVKFENAILQLINNVDLSENMQKHAFEKSKQFLPDAIMKKWNNLFKKLIDA